MLKRIGRSPRTQKLAGTLIAGYLAFVHRTSRFVVEPADLYDRLDADQPVIWAVWHGQHLLVAYFRKPEYRTAALLSRHRDGEINAQALARMGVTGIRGSGNTRRDGRDKGGAPAFRAMLRALDEGTNIVLTADVPKVARRAGLGIVKLAARSGRPIVPLAVATNRRIETSSWDRMAVNLPFARGAFVCGEWLRVPHDADDAALEAARAAVEARLNAATDRAYELVDGRDG